MEDHGTTFKSRWKLLLERIKAMKALWTADEASYHGEFVSFNPVWCWPKPVHKAHPPILVGSYGPRGMQRTIRYGGGWLPHAGPGVDLPKQIGELRLLAERAGPGRFRSLLLPHRRTGSPGSTGSRWRRTCGLLSTGCGSRHCNAAPWPVREADLAPQPVQGEPRKTKKSCKMIDLYYRPTQNGHKVTILLEECELPCAIKSVNTGRGDQLSPSFLKISPNGLMRAIVDHEPDGRWSANHDLRIRLNHDVSRRKDREILATGAASQI